MARILVAGCWSLQGPHRHRKKARVAGFVPICQEVGGALHIGLHEAGLAPGRIRRTSLAGAPLSALPVPTGVFVRAHEQRLLKAGGASLGKIAEKTGIPKTHLHRYLTDVEPAT